MRVILGEYRHPLTLPSPARGEGFIVGDAKCTVQKQKAPGFWAEGFEHLFFIKIQAIVNRGYSSLVEFSPPGPINLP